MENYNTKCPYCHSYIHSESGICRYCGESLINNPKPPTGNPTSSPPENGEWNSQVRPQTEEPQAQPPRPPRPKSHLAGAILVTLFCCQIFGIVSIVFAAQVDSAYNRGDAKEAERLSQQAMTWINVSLITGLVFTILYVILVAAGVAGDLY